MANTSNTHSSHASNARSIVGPAMLIEVSHLQRSHGYSPHSAAEINKKADQDLIRLLAATTLCGFGLLLIALIR